MIMHKQCHSLQTVVVTETLVTIRKKKDALCLATEYSVGHNVPVFTIPADYKVTEQPIFLCTFLDLCEKSNNFEIYKKKKKKKNTT